MAIRVRRQGTRLNSRVAQRLQERDRPKTVTRHPPLP
jgi:hypothetical protein